MIIFFFLPAISAIQQSIDKYGELAKKEDKIPLYSFGALIKFIEPGKVPNFTYQERE